MIEIRLRSFPRASIIWYAEKIRIPNRFTASEVLFRQCREKPHEPGCSVEEFTTLLIDLTASEETLWNGVQQRTREYINSAEKEKPEISFSQQDSDLSAYKFTCRFIEERGFGAPPPLRFYRQYEKRCLISSLKLGGVTRVVHFYMLDYSLGRARLMWSARDLEFQTSKFNKFLHWKDLLYLKNSLKFKVYDFGGLGVNKEELAGIDRFKMNFGGSVVTEYDVRWVSPFYNAIKKLTGR